MFILKSVLFYFIECGTEKKLLIITNCGCLFEKIVVEFKKMKIKNKR